MDPTANLKEQLELAELLAGTDDGDRLEAAVDAQRLAELVLALHEWISKGGFLPRQWKGKQQ